MKDKLYKETKKKINKGRKKGENSTYVSVLKITSVIVILLIQLLIIYFLHRLSKSTYSIVNIGFFTIKVAAVLYIIYRHDSAAYKISWIVFIMFFPVAGIVIYLLWGNSKLKISKVKSLSSITDRSEYLIDSDNIIKNEILKKDKKIYNQINYINNVAGYPVYKNEGVEYLKTGEMFFGKLIDDLKKAKEYIFLEFYIISQGGLLNEILSILKEKSKQGVKVIIIMDSLGSIFRTPKNFIEDLKEYGIEIHRFNPFDEFVNGYINYRDHRKIVVIDGIVAYTGGVNIADEYVNIIEKYGYWKDNGIRVKGKVAWSFTVMFLRTLEFITSEKSDYEFFKKTSEENLKNLIIKKEEGYIVPYSDGPNNRKNPAQNIYVQTISNAKDYIYITSPYLAISELVLETLLNSARSGVDVRIVLPYIPDKKFVNVVTKSFYEVLLEAGVKIYEYTPGFIHSKMFLSDDEVSIVGTANLDFRSFHINYECGLYTYITGVEKDIKKDFEKIFNDSKEVSKEEWKKRPFSTKVLEAVLSAISPMF